MQARFILKKTILTEKTAWLIERRNVYTFEVPLDANKVDIKLAVEAVFEVKVERVRTARRPPVACRFKGRAGFTSETKRAIVKLRAGDKIVAY